MPVENPGLIIPDDIFREPALLRDITRNLYEDAIDGHRLFEEEFIIISKNYLLGLRLVGNKLISKLDENPSMIHDDQIGEAMGYFLKGEKLSFLYIFTSSDQHEYPGTQKWNDMRDHLLHAEYIAKKYRTEELPSIRNNIAMFYRSDAAFALIKGDTVQSDNFANKAFYILKSLRDDTEKYRAQFETQLRAEPKNNHLRDQLEKSVGELSDYHNNLGEIYMFMAESCLYGDTLKVKHHLDNARRCFFASINELNRYKNLLKSLGEEDKLPNFDRRKITAYSNYASLCILDIHFQKGVAEIENGDENKYLVNVNDILEHIRVSLTNVNERLQNGSAEDKEYFRAEIKRRQLEVMIILYYIKQKNITDADKIAKEFGFNNGISPQAVLHYHNHVITESKQHDDRLLAERTRKRAQLIFGTSQLPLS